jgi:4-carboxymuconolactone decarboxylase
MGGKLESAVLAGVVLSLFAAAAQVRAAPAPQPPPPRLAALAPDAWTPEQKEVAVKFGATFGGRPPAGPFAVFQRRPAYANAAIEMYNDIKGPEGWDSPDNRLVNLATLIVARHWGANLEWSSHAASSLKSGVEPEVIAAIRDGRTPSFTRDDERAVYLVVDDLLTKRGLPQTDYDMASAVLGRDTLVKIVLTTGFYATIAMTLVSFDNSVPGPTVYQPLPALPATK